LVTDHWQALSVLFCHLPLLEKKKGKKAKSGGTKETRNGMLEARALRAGS
jgi:hypothetical protein